MIKNQNLAHGIDENTVCVSFWVQCFPECCRKKASAWENFYTDWLELSPSRIMVVHFEVLGRELERILRDIMSFLGLEVDEKRLKVNCNW